MENSNIAWTHNTQNYWLGCDKIAPECAHCYIGRTLRQQGREPWGQLYRTKTWNNPAKWQKQAEARGVCYRVFTNSLSDFFHAKADAWREEAWNIIRETPNLIWLILTKRPELVASRLPKDWSDGYPNVWLGTSVGCNQTLNTVSRSLVKGAATRFPANGQTAIIRPYRKTPMRKDENKIRFDLFSEESGTFIQSCYAYASPSFAAELHRQHGYRVRFNDSPRYPQIVEIIEEAAVPNRLNP